ncbi:MAG: DNA-3-methyladenine glycosylase [Armatimonadetes bacterium]|nr:DNA-3-methyladenine glycosylase [Armatimonadota bacterium]
MCSRPETLPERFWQQDTLAVARALPGKLLVSDIGNWRTAGRIVEVEAYVQDDAASHSYRGQTPRNAPMFGPPGRVYVYYIYGNHWCLNFVSAPEGVGEAVLIRAIEPLQGLETMAERRRRQGKHELLSGPGKLCQAMGITGALNSHPLDVGPLQLLDDGWDPGPLVETTRVGITSSADKPWRFYPRRSVEWVSRK